MDLDDGRLTYESHRQDQARDAILSKELAANAGQRAADDFDVHAFLEERMRVVLELRRHEALDCGELVFTNRLGPAVDRDEGRHPEHREHAETLDERKAGEAVAREEGQLDLLLTILPLTPGIAHGKKGVDVPLPQLIAHALLVAGPSLQRVPPRLAPRLGG